MINNDPSLKALYCEWRRAKSQAAMAKNRDEIFSACREGDFEKVEKLYNKNVPLNVTTAENRFSLMHVALYCHHTELAIWLLKKGATFHLSDNKFGETPFHVACKLGNTRVIKALIVKGAEVNGVDFIGCTPFHLACSPNKHKTAELCARLALRLYAAGADPCKVNNEGYLPYDCLDESTLPPFGEGPPEPFDAHVWTLILDRMPKKDVFSNVTRTCKGLYNLAIKTLVISLQKY
jgi:ankyrin repeat protein